MSLQSFGFFGFLLVVAAVYLHLPQRWQSAFLLAASWVFYALAMPSMLPVTIAIAVFTYLCGRGMTAREGARKTAFLRIGVVGLLAILAFFKYNGAFASDGGWQAVAMPLGISFSSFAAISYLIDAARGDCEVEKNFIDCALFLNFFATVTQGPICRAGALMPQFKTEHRFDAARTVRALRLLALGLFKLVAVSDVMGKSSADAKTMLEGQKLKVQLNEVYSDSAAGTVIAQLPNAGSMQPEGTVIVLTVSKVL